MDELQISGKRFISSRRLAREHGYTADYLGQLIRGGKVVGQKVGRAWYVDAASFDAYLGGEAKQNPPPRRDEHDPNSSAEDSVLPQTPAPVPAPVTVEEPVVVVPVATAVVEEKKEEPAYYVPLHIQKEEPVEKPKEATTGGLHYYADDEPSLPEIRSNRSESRIAELSIAPRARTSAPAPKTLLWGLAGAGLAVFIFSAVLSSALSLNLSIEAGNTASTWYSLQW